MCMYVSLCTFLWSVVVTERLFWVYFQVLFFFFLENCKHRFIKSKRMVNHPCKKIMRTCAFTFLQHFAVECCLFSFRFQAFHFDPAPNLLCLRLPSVFSFHFAIYYEGLRGWCKQLARVLKMYFVIQNLCSMWHPFVFMQIREKNCTSLCLINRHDQLWSDFVVGLHHYFPKDLGIRFKVFVLI